MTYFLTSSPCVEGASLLNPANGFVEELRRAISAPCRALFICSDPDNAVFTDRHGGDIRDSFEASGFVFTDYSMLDGRNIALAPSLVRSAELIILAGGHVPTQNRFFAEIHLRELLKGFQGVVVGISAGTMNSADLVYAQPELEGESVSVDYRRFLPGLGITRAMILPHYQKTRHFLLDGRRLFEDITYSDSMGRKFYALPDGSYLLGQDGKEELRGEAYLIQDGELERISSINERISLNL
ncbi:MAG: dipeptidase E [Candidatus Onthomonas sp.]